MKKYLSFEQKAALIVTSFLCSIIAGVIMNYLKNPIWVGFCIVNIIGWGISGLFLFITFLVKFVELRTNPELQRKLELYEEMYGKLEINEEKITKGAPSG